MANLIESTLLLNRLVKSDWCASDMLDGYSLLIWVDVTISVCRSFAIFIHRDVGNFLLTKMPLVISSVSLSIETRSKPRSLRKLMYSSLVTRPWYNSFVQSSVKITRTYDNISAAPFSAFTS